MNASGVELNKSYNIKFLGSWSQFDGDYTFIGYSDPATVKILEPTADIFKTFFEDLGLDQSSYDMYVKPTTLVYIAYKLTSRDPVETDEETKFYIPSSLIDFSSSYGFVVGNRLSISVTSGVKVFNSSVDLDKFLTKTTNEIKSTIEKLDDYAGETISVSMRTSEALTTQSEVDLITKTREANVINKNKARQQYQLNIEASERNLYEKLQETQKSKERYDRLAIELSNKINQTEAMRVSNETEANTLNSVKNIMISMLSKLISGEIVISSLGETGAIAFDNLYSQAKESL